MKVKHGLLFVLRIGWKKGAYHSLTWCSFRECPHWLKGWLGGGRCFIWCPKYRCRLFWCLDSNCIFFFRSNCSRLWSRFERFDRTWGTFPPNWWASCSRHLFLPWWWGCLCCWWLWCCWFFRSESGWQQSTGIDFLRWSSRLAWRV